MTPDMPRRAAPLVALLAVTGLVWAVPAGAQTVAGRVTDQTGGVLPGRERSAWSRPRASRPP